MYKFGIGVPTSLFQNVMVTKKLALIGQKCTKFVKSHSLSLYHDIWDTEKGRHLEYTIMDF